jgi:hypothetical protein
MMLVFQITGGKSADSTKKLTLPERLMANFVEKLEIQAELTKGMKEAKQVSPSEVMKQAPSPFLDKMLHNFIEEQALMEELKKAYKNAKPVAGAEKNGFVK